MLQRIEIIGNVVTDAEIKTNSENKEFVVFRVAVNDTISDEKKTTYYDVYMGKNGLVPYLKKGRLIYVSGKPSFTANVKDSKAYTNISISSKDVELLGGPKEM